MEALSPDLEHRALAQHSNASPDWGTPMVVRAFAAAVLRPAAHGKTAIDLDYASSAYWQKAWPDASSRPAAYLDGSRGRDVLIEQNRRRVLKQCGSGFLNPPGLGGGEMVQQCWELFEMDHQTEWLDSGVWVGFSLEQFASLQDVCERNPLSFDQGVTTIVPSRRARYLAHPLALIALAKKKQARRKPEEPMWKALAREIRKLQTRKDDSPLPGQAPPHASYLSILWAKNRKIREQQMAAARAFLKEQANMPRSLFQTVAIVGEI